MRTKMIAALVYLTAAVSFAMFLDSVYGAGLVTRGTWRLKVLMVGLVLFVAASILSIVVSRIGLICAICAELLLWSIFGIEAVSVFPWRDLSSVLQYSNWLEIVTALLSLVVSTLYSVAEVRRSRQTRTDQQRKRTLGLITAFAYALSMLVMGNWRCVEEWIRWHGYGG